MVGGILILVSFGPLSKSGKAKTSRPCPEGHQECGIGALPLLQGHCLPQRGAFTLWGLTRTEWWPKQPNTADEGLLEVVFRGFCMVPISV